MNSENTLNKLIKYYENSSLSKVDNTNKINGINNFNNVETADMKLIVNNSLEFWAHSKILNLNCDYFKNNLNKEVTCDENLFPISEKEKIKLPKKNVIKLSNNNRNKKYYTNGMILKKTGDTKNRAKYYSMYTDNKIIYIYSEKIKNYPKKKIILSKKINITERNTTKKKGYIKLNSFQFPKKSKKGKNSIEFINAYNNTLGRKNEKFDSVYEKLSSSSTEKSKKNVLMKLIKKTSIEPYKNSEKKNKFKIFNLYINGINEYNLFFDVLLWMYTKNIQNLKKFSKDIKNLMDILSLADFLKMKKEFYDSLFSSLEINFNQNFFDSNLWSTFKISFNVLEKIIPFISGNYNRIYAFLSWLKPKKEDDKLNYDIKSSKNFFLIRNYIKKYKLIYTLQKDEIINLKNIFGDYIDCLDMEGIFNTFILSSCELQCIECNKSFDSIFQTFSENENNNDETKIDNGQSDKDIIKCKDNHLIIINQSINKQ